MAKKEKKDSFWLSYSDLMTSLFFIMLVLFIAGIVAVKPISFDVEALRNENASLKQKLAQVEKDLKDANEKIKQLKQANGSLQASYDQIQKLLRLEDQFKTLSSSSVLRYEPNRKTFIAKKLEGIEIFNPESDIILNSQHGTVLQVGKELERVLCSLNQDNPEGQYLLVIEGTSANKSPNPWDKDRDYNYRLSFSRAMALYSFWKKNGIDLRKYNTEIQICGSGLNGINRDNMNEANNKRFVIQILPKVSKPK